MCDSYKLCLLYVKYYVIVYRMIVHPEAYTQNSLNMIDIGFSQDVNSNKDSKFKAVSKTCRVMSVFPVFFACHVKSCSIEKVFCISCIFEFQWSDFVATLLLYIISLHSGNANAVLRMCWALHWYWTICCLGTVETVNSNINICSREIKEIWI